MSRIVRAVVMVGGLWGAAAATADTAQDKLTEAKLQADLGRYAEAAAAFEALAGDPGTARLLRAEALVRLGAVRQAAGEARAAVEAFERVMKEHADDEAAIPAARSGRRGRPAREGSMDPGLAAGPARHRRGRPGAADDLDSLARSLLARVQTAQR